MYLDNWKKLQSFAPPHFSSFRTKSSKAEKLSAAENLRMAKHRRVFTSKSPCFRFTRLHWVREKVGWPSCGTKVKMFFLCCRYMFTALRNHQFHHVHRFNSEGEQSLKNSDVLWEAVHKIRFVLLKEKNLFNSLLCKKLVYAQTSFVTSL